MNKNIFIFIYALSLRMPKLSCWLNHNCKKNAINFEAAKSVHAWNLCQPLMSAMYYYQNSHYHLQSAFSVMQVAITAYETVSKVVMCIFVIVQCAVKYVKYYFYLSDMNQVLAKSGFLAELRVIVKHLFLFINRRNIWSDYACLRV